MELPSIIPTKWLLPLGLATMVSLPVPVLAFRETDVFTLRTDGSCRFCDLSDADLSVFNLQPQGKPTDLMFADLTRANLSFADLTKANLSETDLSSARLRGTNLRQADLTQAVLTGALVEGANFTGANLTKAFLFDLRGRPQGLPSLRASIFNTDIPTFTNFTDAILDDVLAKNTDLPNAVFSGASLLGSNFSGSDLSGVDFTDADLSGAIFYNVNLFGANITSEQIQSLRAFSGILPDGTSVATVPEPNLAFALMGLGLWGVREATRRKR